MTPRATKQTRSQKSCDHKNRQSDERIRELTCVYEISRLKNDPNLSLDDFLSRTVRLIPSGWRDPETTCARIVFQGREFLSDGFRENEVCQTAELVVAEKVVGSVEVILCCSHSEAPENPFLQEGRVLLDTLASGISSFIRYKQDDLKLQQTSSKLREEQQLLKDKNTALREVLQQIENEKRHITSQVQTNVDRVVGPILRTLANKVSSSEHHYLTLLSSSLTDITSPFLSNLENRARMLSPREGEICNMIRNGMSSKEIAAVLDVSLYTVLKQRQRIRKKLGITSEKTNLASYLQTV